MTLAERFLKDKIHARLNMVSNQLRPNGIRDFQLIRAFESVSMEAFLPPATQSLAYSDSDLPLTIDTVPARWLLAPLTLGKLLQIADIQPSDKVLIVGCGVGYSLALVAQLAFRVVGVESYEDLARVAAAYGLEQGSANVEVMVGALSVGYPKDAPYDVILIEGAVEKIPAILTQQLAPEGRLVTVIKRQIGMGRKEFGKGILITRKGDALVQVDKFDASCPHLPEFEPTSGFRL
ncbi:MAG: protein-L-isoaspartate O-methyltransferase family protein [Candidatus Paracaedibacter sp.]